MGSKDKVDSNNKRLSSTEKKMIWVFLIGVSQKVC